jgi:hypothetical protein
MFSPVFRQVTDFPWPLARAGGLAGGNLKARTLAELESAPNHMRGPNQAETLAPNCGSPTPDYRYGMPAPRSSPFLGVHFVINKPPWFSRCIKGINLRIALLIVASGPGPMTAPNQAGNPVTPDCGSPTADCRNGMDHRQWGCVMGQPM